MKDSWQPIETAPKDGTLVLLGDFAFTQPYYLIAQWSKRAKRWETWRMSNGSFACWTSATHWQPLLRAPGTGAKPDSDNVAF